ncbi:cytochrome c biogenesis protein CcmE [Candidatus Endobugula sertula]|uniref:Cytochrome c-type biogenesis protein CcmE n=1 Tax=Candidatus Endobugula sertula TaxID=62101 RepID=A0A1D2QT29_9GAMM|nr:cytochrome c biogenesis protein CcmE [Candidatus Endobugula sertula]
MHPVRRQRLFIILFIVIFSSIAVLLLAFALRENINLFYPPQKIVAGEAPIGTQIRAGGCVVRGSIKRASNSLKVDFRITDGVVSLPVTYMGILPDLFAEGEATVVSGKLDSVGVFNATEVLAKHDENYMPPEVAEAMAASGETEHQQTCNKI